MFETLKADFNRYYALLPAGYGTWKKFVFYLQCQGMWAILDFRFRQWLVKQNAWIRKPLGLVAFPMHILTASLTGIWIPTACRIGKGLYIGHFTGIFLHDDVVLGENCNLSQGVTLGLGGKDDHYGSPEVGNNTYFGAGSKVIGKIRIGNNVRIGANAVVLESIPDGATAVGIPARVVRQP